MRRHGGVPVAVTSIVAQELLQGVATHEAFVRLDCLIARTASEHDLPLLHDDGDFDEMARVVSEMRLA